MLINKMNKTKSSKISHKSQHPMRVLLKMRGNHNGVMRTLENDSQTDHLTNQSFVIAEDQEEDYEQRYTQSRMKTEYSDRFGTFQRNNFSFHQLKHPHQKQTASILTPESETNSVANAAKSYLKLDYIPPKDDSVEKKTIETKKEEEVLPLIREVAPSFEDIEDKIQNIMSKRLNQCLEFKKKGDWVIDTELAKLIEAYKQIKTSKNPETQEDDIHLLSRKIAMLEKLIAESMTESDIVKKYYLGKVANHHWKQHKTQSFSNVEPVRSINWEHKQEALVNTSNNQQSYQQPNRNAYNLEKRGNYFFNPDRHMQPLPRSSYNRDFLSYGAVKNLSACKPSENECLKAAASAKIMNSSYRSNFIPKKVERINIKELDACRDKIKNLPIIFGKKEKDIIAYNLATFLQIKKGNTNANYSHSLERVDAGNNPHHFTTEARKQFIKAVQISPSEIKHRNLQRLKYGYKKELHV